MPYKIPHQLTARMLIANTKPRFYRMNIFNDFITLKKLISHIQLPENTFFYTKKSHKN